MEKVTGIGGFFFRAHDPKALALWYQEHLGISITPTGPDQQPWVQEAGPTAFNPFPESTKYFGDPKQMWMINFRVRNIDAMVKQLRDAGITVEDPKVLEELRRDFPHGALDLVQIPGLGPRKAAMLIRGKWIVELGELDSLTRADLATAKLFFSQATDRYRAPWAKRPTDVPRQCVFGGTVNLFEFLRDETLRPVCKKILRIPGGAFRHGGRYRSYRRDVECPSRSGRFISEGKC